MAIRSSHSAFSCLDNVATSWAEFALLASRVLVGWLFLMTGWGKVSGIPGATAYFTGLGVPSPELWPYVIGPIEILIGLTLIFGLATRYAGIITFIFVVIATAMAHRYWTYPAAQQAAQYSHFLKNLAIMAAGLLIFIQGGGRYSIDAILAKK
jgi:putative oxidoreductase